MPFALLALLGLAGGGALLYFLGKKSGEHFDLADCIDKYKKMGYTNDKAVELCRLELNALEKQETPLETILKYAIPAGVLSVGAFLLYKEVVAQKAKKRHLNEESINPEEVEKQRKELSSRLKEMAENAYGIIEVMKDEQELDRVSSLLQTK